jgi:hypothetical protein
VKFDIADMDFSEVVQYEIEQQLDAGFGHSIETENLHPVLRQHFILKWPWHLCSTKDKAISYTIMRSGIFSTNRRIFTVSSMIFSMKIS